MAEKALYKALHCTLTIPLESPIEQQADGLNSQMAFGRSALNARIPVGILITRFELHDDSTIKVEAAFDHDLRCPPWTADTLMGFVKGLAVGWLIANQFNVTWPNP